MLTSGEDGQVKTWSKAGMLRSTLASSENPVYAAAWGPDSSAVVFCSCGEIVILPLQSGSKKLSWQGHDSTILRLDWSSVTDLLVSGGEDCRYKVSLPCSLLALAERTKGFYPVDGCNLISMFVVLAANARPTYIQSGPRQLSL